MVLPIEFWNAFLNKLFPKTLDYSFSPDIKKFISLIEGYGYAHNIYDENWNYYISIIAIKDLCYISVWQQNDFRQTIGTIEYNLRRKKKGKSHFEVQYYSRKAKIYSKAFQTLCDIANEISSRKNKKYEIIPRKTGGLPYLKTINIIICCIWWEKLITSNLTLKEKAEEIVLKTNLKLDPVTVAYYATCSTDPNVIYEATYSQKIISGAKKEISKKWLQLKVRKPKLQPIEIAESLSKSLKLDISTILSYARFSSNKEIKNDVNKIHKKVYCDKYDLTTEWIKLDKTLSPSEKAEKIANKLSISAISVAEYARNSENSLVRKEAKIANNRLYDKLYNITKKWKILILTQPNLKSYTKAKKIAMGLNKNPSYIAGYARYSNDTEVKKEANEALMVLISKKKKIDDKWIDLIIKFPNISPIERATHLSKDLSMKPITVANYGSYSYNKQVKTDASLAKIQIIEKSHSITEKWLTIKSENLNKNPVEISKEIGSLLNLEPITVTSYAMVSNNKIVRAEAYKAKKKIYFDEYFRKK